MFKNANHDVPTTKLYLDRIINETWCNKHKASIGAPCWGMPELSGLGRSAVCNSRAKKAGFNNKISEGSLRRGNRRKT